MAPLAACLATPLRNIILGKKRNETPNQNRYFSEPEYESKSEPLSKHSDYSWYALEVPTQLAKLNGIEVSDFITFPNVGGRT